MGKSDDSKVTERVQGSHDHNLHVGPEEEAELLLPPFPESDPDLESGDQPPING